MSFVVSGTLPAILPHPVGQAGMVRGVEEVVVDMGALALDMGAMVVMVDIEVMVITVALTVS